MDVYHLEYHQRPIILFKVLSLLTMMYFSCGQHQIEPVETQHTVTLYLTDNFVELDFSTERTTRAYHNRRNASFRHFNDHETV